MTTGKVLYIYTVPTAGAELQPCDSVLAVPGKGLEGDRYAELRGSWSEDKVTPDREVTLIEIENIEGLTTDYGIDLHPSQFRRNIVTQGISLNELVDSEFRVGDVKMRGIRLCEPCTYLEGLTVKGLVKALVHKGGLRAQLLSEGTIHVDDNVIVEAYNF